MSDENADRRTHWTVDSLKEHFEELRRTDREAVELAHADLSRRLEGFPQQFATKADQDAARETLQRLERDSISRELYEQNHQSLAALVAKLDKDKMPESVFETFVENYRLEQERAAEERRAVAAALASTAARQSGVAATWTQIGAIIVIVIGVLSFVVLLANYFLR